MWNSVVFETELAGLCLEEGRWQLTVCPLGAAMLLCFAHYDGANLLTLNYCRVRALCCYRGGTLVIAPKTLLPQVGGV